MKKIAIMLLAITTGLSLFADLANTKGAENLSHNVKIMNIKDLNEEALSEITNGKHPDVAIQFSAHTLLPIRFFLRGDLLNLMEENCGKVEVKQTFYVRFEKGELLLSSNLSEWKPMLEFTTGSVTIGFNTEDGQPLIQFGADTNRR